jgi:hypothetical protein
VKNESVLFVVLKDTMRNAYLQYCGREREREREREWAIPHKVTSTSPLKKSLKNRSEKSLVIDSTLCVKKSNPRGGCGK